MQCGAKCFLVEIEIGGEKLVKSVTTRTPISARKVIRKKYGGEAQILSVKRGNDE